MGFRYSNPEDSPRSRLYGYVIATYDQLFACFGLPNELFSDTQKVACEWSLVFEDGTYATLYTYCEPTGQHPELPEGRYEWHTGGRSNYAVDRIVEALETGEFRYLQPDDYDQEDFSDIPF